ncbi:hypothetical protein BKA62DRAFT_719491 [Auriculariales sp. MPI-PUGE-AT-0066]|nr:hypothetical protein BKA62DRAFT_719491 [Auriculariales sp. MPI-PUGE-AT-0066]
MSAPPYPFEHAPAPWLLKGTAYWMFLKGLDAKQPLPDAAYHPLEQPGPDMDPVAANPKFMGGLGVVWIIRYEEGPVGPYDELIYLPGTFESPNGKSESRITRIYVSSAVSVFNGRTNWNIAKHLARFAFTPLASDPRKTLVEVFEHYPEDRPAGVAAAKPFFAAVFAPQRFVPAMPLNTKWLGLGALPQPPLRKGPHDEEAGTEKWQGFECIVKGWTRGVWWEPAPMTPGSRIAPGEYADGHSFPKVKIWSFGTGWDSGTLAGAPGAQAQAE